MVNALTVFADMKPGQALFTRMLVNGSLWVMKLSYLAVERACAVGQKNGLDELKTCVEMALENREAGDHSVITIHLRERDNHDAAFVVWIDDDEIAVDACRFVDVGPMEINGVPDMKVMMPAPATLTSTEEDLAKMRESMRAMVSGSNTEFIDVDKPQGPAGCN
jgi:hypothetical protein